MTSLSYKKLAYADIHLHLGGAIQPRIMWHQITEVERTDELAKAGFDSYNKFEAFFKQEREDLADYLKMFNIVEPLQNIDRLEYFVKRLMRGAFEFENLSYIELRYCPYSRTSPDTEEKRISQMKAVVLLVHETIKKYSNRTEGVEYYPINIQQILCLHSKYSANVNAAVLDLAIEMKKEGIVCGIDIAGGEDTYDERFDEILNSFKRAKDPVNGLMTTAHIFETKHTPTKAKKLLEYLDRIGHGILLPMDHHYLLDELRERGICLEICPTTYLKCNTFKHYNELAPIFRMCEQSGVDVTVCTDNSGMHMSRLQGEFEALLIHHVISHTQMNVIRKNAFKHSFGLTADEKKLYLQDMSIKINLGNTNIDIEL